MKLWRHLEWPVVWAVAVVAFCLGLQGFLSYGRFLGAPISFWDGLYLSLQLFVLESGSVQGTIPWTLQAGRFLAPAVTAYTATKALTVLFRDQFRLLRLWRLTGHVVVVGFGRRGRRFARCFRDAGFSVVAVERNGDGVPVKAGEEQDLVVFGDARDGEILRKARLEKARALVVVTGDDGVNAEVAIQARALIGERPGDNLTCLAHITEPALCQLLRAQEIESPRMGPFLLEFFNSFENSILDLWSRNPPFTAARVAGGMKPHLLVVGLGRMGETLVLAAARHWQALRPAAQDLLLITIVDREAAAKVDSLQARYPYVNDTCRCRAVTGAFTSGQAASLLPGLEAEGLTAAYVCFDDDVAAFSTGLAFATRLHPRGVPVFVRMSREKGLSALLRGPKCGRFFDGMHTFGSLERICTPDVLGHCSREELARALHERYVEKRTGQGAGSPADPAAVPWGALGKELMDSNRRQADHLGLKLRAVGCGLVPLTTFEARSFQFSPEEVELLASMEHRRWFDEREGDGWVCAPGPKNLKRKTSPSLVPYEMLPNEMKEANRATVRELPALLVDAGFSIVRICSAQGSTRCAPPE